MGRSHSTQKHAFGRIKPTTNTPSCAKNPAMHKEIITRHQAYILGLDRYFTGIPCKNGHIAARYMRGGKCVECNGGREYLSSLEFIQERELKKRKKIEELIEWMKSLEEQKREEQRHDIRWHRVRENGGFYTKEDIKFLMDVQRGKCAHSWCRVSLKAGHHIDHIMPVALGGGSDRRNLQLLCPPCNLSKSARHPIDFAQMHGLLL